MQTELVKLNFGKKQVNGRSVVLVIIQDERVRRINGFFFLSEQAMLQTLETKLLHIDDESGNPRPYQRSHHQFRVTEVQVDCDGDAVLFRGSFASYPENLVFLAGDHSLTQFQWRGLEGWGECRLQFHDPEKTLLVQLIVDETGALLMHSYMNQVAWEKSMETSYVHRYSRQHQKLMRKGDESRNTMRINGLAVSEDGDAVILMVHVEGPGHACHHNRRSCFVPVAFEQIQLAAA